MKPLTHGSLFAGIGGFDLGFERAGIKTIWQVEIDEYCRRVLARHFPDAERFSDVREVGKHNLKPVDIICGGFPCQDISIAGKRAGIDGERSGLWSEYFRIVCELRPRLVVVENVAALLNWGIERVLADLASGGYDAEWVCLPAGRIGAHHRRDRVFIIAHRPNSIGLRLQGFGTATERPWSREQFEGLVQAVARVSVPSGRSGGISHGVPHRIQRLHALGNAVVPQIAQWIGERIMDAETI